jgi:hypothetical protein
MEIIEGPAVLTRPGRHSAGIRLTTPFRGMLAVRDQLMDELYAWVDERAMAYSNLFFRLHVVDMGGPMYI